MKAPAKAAPAYALGLLWLALLLLSASYCVSRITAGDAFQSDIRALLPANFAPQLNDALELKLNAAGESNFLILLTGPTAAEGLQLAELLRADLAQVPQLRQLTPPASGPDALKAFYAPYRFQLLDATTRAWLQTNEAPAIAERLLADLHSPLQRFRLYDLAEDPFNLAGDWVQAVFLRDSSFALAAPNAAGIPAIDEGNQTWYLLRGLIAGSPFELEVQQAIGRVLAEFLSQHGGDQQLLVSGLVFHAAEGAATARAEISIVGLGSLLGILLLTIAVFRSARPLLAILVTLAASSLVALAVSLWLFGRVHLVTLAFGTTLLGLAVDYCFHFLLKYSALESGTKALKLLAKGLLISLGSSVAAYLLQFLSPFPGLQQFAVFVASGLVMAAVTLVTISCFYHDPHARRVLPCFRVYSAVVVPCYERLASRPGWLAVLALGLLVAGVVQLWQQGGNDDIRLLNTSSPELLRSEQEVRRMLGDIETLRYFLISADSAQQVLERTEDLVSAVQTLGIGADGLYAPSDLVPSLQRQREDYHLIADKLYGTEGALALVCEQLAADCNLFAPLPTFNPNLTPNNLPGELEQTLASRLLISEQQAILMFRAVPEPQLRQFGEVAQQLSGVTLVDQVQSISATLADYRQHIGWLLGLFLGLLAIGSFILFGCGAYALLISLSLSMLAALVFAVQDGLSLFHLLAVLLVMGITIDMAVFYLQPGLAADTWLASSLACATSMLAFGLLAFSQVPILRQFGTVVLGGLLCSWLVTPLVFFATHNNLSRHHNKRALALAAHSEE